MRNFLLAGAAVGSIAASPAPSIDQRISAQLGQSFVTVSSVDVVKARCDALISLGAEARTAIEARRGAASMEGDFKAYDRLSLLLGDGYGEMNTIVESNTNAAVRKAAEECQVRLSDASTSLGLSRPVYDRLSGIATTGLPDSSKFTLNKVLTNFRLAGVDRDQATRDKVTALQKEITDIGLKFDGNIRDDKGDLGLSTAELEGLPQDWLDSHKPGADGLVHITRDYPDILPVLDFAKLRETRRKAAIFFRNRGYPQNEAVLNQLLKKRHELATLLGYPSYAALITADKMVGSPERVAAFIDEVKAASDPASEADKAELTAFARTLDPSIDRLESWDTSYFSNLLRKRKYSVDSAEVRQYFSYDKARSGIISLVHDLFGADIRPWKTDVWAPEVSAWELYDKGKLVGRFYLDMHPREGKFNHAAMFPIRTGVAGQQVPVGALLTNFPATGPMDHGDVETFLHEFGHLIHYMYSGHTAYGAQSMANLQWDFIEAPSQLLEEWVWDYDTLRGFATNAKGEAIPAALVQRMNAGRFFGEAMGARGQLAYSAVSLNYYNRPPGFDLKQMFDAQVAKYGTMPIIPEAHPYAGFGHLNGYSAIYYTYVWSKAIAVDLLTRFKTAGLRSPDVAMRYRKLVLGPGGSKDANVLISDFLGRPLSLASYKEYLRKKDTGSASGQ